MQVVIWADPISPDGTPEDTLDACLQTIDDFDRKVHPGYWAPQRHPVGTTGYGWGWQATYEVWALNQDCEGGKTMGIGTQGDNTILMIDVMFLGHIFAFEGRNAG
jgi:hypothetical protein